MATRWLNVFRGKKIPLYNSLVFELTNTREVAATDAVLSAVGLVVSPDAIIRKFAGDVWSEVNKSGKLMPTRHHSRANGTHTEYFCKPIYTAIVVNKSRITQRELAAVRRISDKFNLKIKFMRE